MPSLLSAVLALLTAGLGQLRFRVRAAYARPHTCAQLALPSASHSSASTLPSCYCVQYREAHVCVFVCVCVCVSPIQAAELELSSLARMAEGAEAEFAYEDQQQAALELASLPTDTQATPSTSAQQQQGPAQQSVFASMTGAGGPVVGAAHAPFASMSLGLSRAGQVAMNALTKAAKRAATRRPHVLRPSHMRRRRAAGPSAAQQVQ